MGNSFLDLAYDVLKQSPTPLTYQQIWETAVSTGLSSKIGSTGKTPWQSLGSRVYVEVRDNPSSKIVKIGARPARFWLRERQAELPSGAVQKLDKEDSRSVEKKADFKERDLHPLLAYFAYANSNFNRGRFIFTKTIEHAKSTRSGYNEWIHPDMAGFYLPLEDWHEDVLSELPK